MCYSYFQIVALTIVRGNIPVNQALENTARFLKMTDSLHVNIHTIYEHIHGYITHSYTYTTHAWINMCALIYAYRHIYIYIYMHHTLEHI